MVRKKNVYAYVQLWLSLIPFVVKPLGYTLDGNTKLLTQLFFLNFGGIIGNFMKKLVQNIHLLRCQRRPNAKQLQESLKWQNWFIIYSFIHSILTKFWIHVYILSFFSRSLLWINHLSTCLTVISNWNPSCSFWALVGYGVWLTKNWFKISNCDLENEARIPKEASKSWKIGGVVHYLRLFLLLLNQMLTWLMVIPNCSLNMDFWFLSGYLEMFWKKSFIIFNCSSVKPVRMPKFANKHELAACEGGNKKKIYQYKGISFCFYLFSFDSKTNWWFDRNWDCTFLRT